MSAEELFIQSYQDKEDTWNRAADKYLLENLSTVLNTCPPFKDKAVYDMNEKDCNDWLKSCDSVIKEKAKLSINIHSKVAVDRLGSECL